MINNGAGRPILFLHPAIGLNPRPKVLERLAELGQLFAPSHPGFGGSELPRHFNSVDDLSYLYLDLLERLDVRDAVVIGVSFGAWIAAEIATKSVERISRLILASPLGIKVGARQERDIADMFMLSREEFDSLAYRDPATFALDMSDLSADQIREYARNWEAAALFGWLPYMHNPKLGHRLHRVTVPTLVLWGDSDKVISHAYAAAFAALLPNAEFAVIPDAGHYPHIEQPTSFVAAIARFVAAQVPTPGPGTSAILSS
jgi:pimeloyl-ACP methyl ester carboxylesterase